jgi:Protein of unknown function (DUF3551)
MVRATFTLLAVVATVSAIHAHHAAAEIYRPWCVHYLPDNGTNCGFHSYEQCMATARGAGARCAQNPWYLQYGSGQKTLEQDERPRRR